MSNPALPTAPILDIQINGGFGVDLNTRSLSHDDWFRFRADLFADGTRYFLPTLITDSPENLIFKLDMLSGLISESRRIADPKLAIPVGIHLEGPFISGESGFVGAHPASHARLACLELAEQFWEASMGTLRLVTLAPEQDPQGRVTRFFTNRGVVVGAGHTDASRDQLQTCIDQGLSLITHLGNGIPQKMNRHDNIIHRVLSLKDELIFSLILDGHHVPFWLARLWIDMIGWDRIIAISDAISAAGLPAGTYWLGDQQVQIGEDLVPRTACEQYLMGSGTTLGRMKRLVESQFDWESSRIDQIFFKNPTRLLGLDQNFS